MPYIHMWPNPTTGSVTITLPEVLTGKDIAVTDLSGKQLWSATATTQRVSLPTGTLPVGIYMVRVGGISKKLVVVK